MRETSVRLCGCGAECTYALWEESRENEYGLCWGEVTVVDEITYEDGDYGWVHACEGHRDLYFGGEYISNDL